MHRKEQLRQLRREQDWKEASEELQAIFRNYQLEQQPYLLNTIEPPKIVVHQPTPQKEYGNGGANFQMWYIPASTQPAKHQQSHDKSGLCNKM